ncbi:hypothetical protein RRG08_025707 [Elysia crispata]|uniref:Uncharacterized protein n=1 Tax=Elysia crispata TaxID=231223 RepID=A0AAE1DYX8_9GAST|nr:hypothetical protein RRG08_025707 [Elysia crispata]
MEIDLRSQSRSRLLGGTLRKDGLGREVHHFHGDKLIRQGKGLKRTVVKLELLSRPVRTWCAKTPEQLLVPFILSMSVFIAGTALYEVDSNQGPLDTDVSTSPDAIFNGRS